MKKWWEKNEAVRCAVLHAGRDLLIEAAEDGSRYDMLLSQVSDATAAEPERAAEEVALDLIERLLLSDLVLAADLDPDDGELKPWNLSTPATLRRLRQRINDDKRTPLPHGVGWFLPTPAGRQWLIRYYALLDELGGR